jgi:DDE superfamily endonuclease
MRTLPAMMLHLLNPFMPLFSRRLWPHVQVLLAGAILAPGKRTVSAALRVMGLGQTEQFQRYHRVLNRAVWSGREVSRVLLDPRPYSNGALMRWPSGDQPDAGG